MEYTSFDQIVEKVQNMTASRAMAVAGAADNHVIEAVLEAKDHNLANPILCGDVEKIKEILRAHDRNPADFDIEAPVEGMNAAELAVEVIKKGGANFLMKGMMDTKDVLKPVVNKANNLHTGRVMSMVACDTFSTYHKILASTDGGMMTYPTLEQKKEIIQNAVEAFHALGYENPKVACLTAVEKVNPKMPETVEARALQEMNEKGEITGCSVVGPISYDCAMSKEIAQTKSFDCPYCGDFDILLVPNIHVGNILGKCLIVSCKATLAGIVVGAKVPIVLTSRGSSAEEKFYSIALAAYVAANMKR